MRKNDIVQIEILVLLLLYLTATSVAFYSASMMLAPCCRQTTTLYASRQHSETQDPAFKEITDQSTFLRNCQVDNTVRNLREQLPQLLLKPLSLKQIESVYSEDIALTGPRGEELAFGQEELVSLSSTLVAATAAARQANAFASSWTLFNVTTDDVVECQLAMDINLSTLRVEWKVDLLIGQRISKLVGLSDLILNDEGKVCEHVVLDVRLDGQTVSALGETLATLRRAVRTFGDSPLLSGLRDSPLAATLLTDIRKGLIPEQTRMTNETLPVPPLYVVDSVSSAFDTKNKNNSNMTLIDNIPITSPPLPGSPRWTSFAASRRAIARFVEYGLPVLSGKGYSTKDDFAELFAPNVELKGIDGTVLASGRDRIANFYRTLSSLRKGASGDWRIHQVSTDWNSHSVIVDWIATSPIRVEGRDRFQLCDPEQDPVVESIEQIELKLSGNRVKNPEWFRAFVTAIETGKGNVGVDMMVELLQQAGINEPRKPTPTAKGPPKLKPEAAAAFYGILCALHRDLPTLVDANAQSPPAAEYISPDIELRGYLDELLVKGSSSYNQVANVLTASLRTALLTGRVTAEARPSPKIEFTSEGSIKVSLLVKLRVKVTPGESVLGIPLKLELVFEYKVNAEGKIMEHKLVESRVNGQLTPGDVLSRWIKGTTLDDTPNLSLLDALAWARSFSGNNINR